MGLINLHTFYILIYYYNNTKLKLKKVLVMFLNCLNISNFTTDSNNFTWLAESHWDSKDSIYFSQHLINFPHHLKVSPFIRKRVSFSKRKVKNTSVTNLWGSWILKEKKNHNPILLLILEGTSKIYRSCNLYFDTTYLRIHDQELIHNALIQIISALFISAGFDSINIVDSIDFFTNMEEFQKYSVQTFYSWPDFNQIKKIVIPPFSWKEDHESLYKNLEYLNSRKIDI